MATSAEKPPVWLIGSGASKDAGVRMTGEVTEFILDEPFYRDNEGSYQPGDARGPGFPKLELTCLLVRATVRWAFESVRRGGKDQPTYEDVYFYLVQLRDAVSGEYENPALAPAVIEFTDFRRFLIAHEQPYWRDTPSEHELLREACRFLKDALRLAVTPEHEDLAVLSGLIDGLSAAATASHVVATLNHDEILEHALGASPLSYRDGLVDKTPYLREFVPESLELSDAGVALLKLHGSARWTIVQFPDGHQAVGQVTDWEEFEKAQVANPGLDTIEHDLPILIGTHNKIMSYSQPVFWDLMWRFRTALREATRLVVAGYGFADKGINWILIDWLYDHPERRMVVIDPNIEQTRDRCRDAIDRHWDPWKSKNQLFEIEKRMRDTTWADIRAVL